MLLLGEMVVYRQCQRLAAFMVLMIGLFAVSPATAGVGMLGGGESLYNSDVSLRGGWEHWDGSRNKIRSVCQRKYADLVQGYEYGYSYFHTVFASASLAYRNCGQTNPVIGPSIRTGEEYGLGDVQIGVRTRLNHRSTAAWEASLIIPTGYDNNSPSSLGRGALGLALGLRFASDGELIKKKSWGWKLGSTFTYFFASKGNKLSSFASLNYAFSQTNFEQAGDFASLTLSNTFGFSNGGVQRTLFFNQAQKSATNSDVTSLTLGYSRALRNGWSTSFRLGRALFGRNSPLDYSAGWGLSYRWTDK